MQLDYQFYYSNELEETRCDTYIFTLMEPFCFLWKLHLSTPKTWCFENSPYLYDGLVMLSKSKVEKEKTTNITLSSIWGKECFDKFIHVSLTPSVSLNPHFSRMLTRSPLFFYRNYLSAWTNFLKGKCSHNNLEKWTRVSCIMIVSWESWDNIFLLICEILA